MFDQFGEFKRQLPDRDQEETSDWVRSLDSVVEDEGRARAQFILYRVLKRARQHNLGLPPLTSTRYINTISPEQEPEFPGDEQMELRIRRMIRWNAVAMVIRANSRAPGIGGHLATYASAATLYEVGFNHFFRGKDAEQMGDQIFFQGHAAPGIYARAFLEGRLSEDQLDHFRQEVSGKGLSSYPHPRLMPDFWEFPTVSMGLGPLAAIYQARFNRYLQHRGIKDTSKNRVWAFLGDGETDEPEALGSLSVAAREGLDNLTFVVNCNLQRLDGPVRGNGKIIQELESVFRGAGWNVIKVIWAREWDDLLAHDVDGVLVDKMNDTLDGEYQKFSVETGAYIREHFFGTDPRLKEMIAHLSDDDILHLRRGGHDYRKVYAAYDAATRVKDRPTAILVKTVKGWTLGTGVEGRNITHQAKKMTEQELKIFRDRLQLAHRRRQAQGRAVLPPGRQGAGDGIPARAPRGPGWTHAAARRRDQDARTARGDPVYAEFMAGSGTQEASTTMAFAKLLRNLLRDKVLGDRIVPIIPDEARTFGMDPLFKEVGIYSALGQLYDPVDSNLVLSYREAKDGQVLEEGITEAGSSASFQAAGTAYATHAEPMIPFYIFYSMFGFQRTGDEFWAFADARGRGFLLGATAGRTTLNGEGLQHEDGHSLVVASVIPTIRIYDPAFAYETAVIVRDGIERMYGAKPEDALYYLTLYNENYAMPARPESVSDEDIVRGLYRFREAPAVSGGSGGKGGSGGNGAKSGRAPIKATILGGGSIMQQALRAQQILAEKFGVAADVWSALSYQQLRNQALEVDRWNRLHPDEKQRTPLVTELLREPAEQGPIIAVSDYITAWPDMIARWVPGGWWRSLGTDGFGRSDTREALRRFFEIDAESVAAATLAELARCGRIDAREARKGISDLGLDPDAAFALRS